MKNKKLIIFLLFLVIGIWGLIIFKIFIHPNNDKVKSFSNESDSTNFILPEKQDTFSIINSYDDPFRINVEPKAKKGNIILPKPQKVEVKRDWPVIQYNGLIKNQSSSHTVALVNINGKRYVAEPGKEFEKVQLLKIWRDSIQVVFNSERRVIVKRK